MRRRPGLFLFAWFFAFAGCSIVAVKNVQSTGNTLPECLAGCAVKGHAGAASEAASAVRDAAHERAEVLRNWP